MNDLAKMVETDQKHPSGSFDRKVLEKASLEVSSGGTTVPVDVRQLTELQKQLQKSELATRLLETNKTMPVLPYDEMVDPTCTYMLLFMLVIIVLWFGSSNAVRHNG